MTGPYTGKLWERPKRGKIHPFQYNVWSCGMGIHHITVMVQLVEEVLISYYLVFMWSPRRFKLRQWTNLLNVCVTSITRPLVFQSS